MKQRMLSGLFFAGLWAAAGSPVHGAPITFYFSGVVDTAQGPLLDELLAPGWTGADLLGTTFAGSYTFDPDALDGNGGSHIGQYQHYGAPYGMTLHFVHRTFTFGSIDMAVVDDFDIAGTTPGLLDDIYAVQSLEIPSLADPTHTIRGRLDLISSGTALVGPSVLLSDDIPLIPPDPSAFDLDRVFVNVIGTDGFVHAGLGLTVGDLTLGLTPIPEPTSLALLSGGLLLVGATRRARRGRRSAERAGPA